MGLYVAQGSMGEIVVTLCDPGLVGWPQDSDTDPLLFEQPVFFNEPDRLKSVRPQIPNAINRFQSRDEVPPVCR
jgi:hypothetical protein